MKDCINCEKDALMRVAELEIEVENLQEWKYTLEQALEVEHKLMTAYKEENEELQNKLRIYQEHCLNEKKQEPENDYELPFNENVNEMLDNLSDAVKKASKALKGENNE